MHPEKTLCLLDFAAAFRDTATWAERRISPERRAELHDSLAYHFDPSRWLEADNDVESQENDTPLHWPFGQGPRYCPGRAFAQVEMTTVVATIFMDYSLELVVEEELIKACNGDSGLAWEKTKGRALRALIDNVNATSVFICSRKCRSGLLSALVSCRQSLRVYVTKRIMGENLHPKSDRPRERSSKEHRMSWV